MTLEEIVKAAQTAMNTEIGQELTGKLMEKVLEQNPDTTVKEWEDIKARFLAYMTITMAREVRI